MAGGAPRSHGPCCINLRLPTHRGLCAWEFEKAGRELRVRVEGQLVLNSSSLMLDAALAGHPPTRRACGPARSWSWWVTVP
jgi:hypothetical protein